MNLNEAMKANSTAPVINTKTGQIFEINEITMLGEGDPSEWEIATNENIPLYRDNFMSGFNEQVEKINTQVKVLFNKDKIERIITNEDITVSEDRTSLCFSNKLQVFDIREVEYKSGDSNDFIIIQVGEAKSGLIFDRTSDVKFYDEFNWNYNSYLDFTLSNRSSGNDSSSVLLKIVKSTIKKRGICV